MVTTWTAGALAAAPSVPRWTMLCAAAEAVGMAASATATRTAQAMVVDGAADPISGLALIAAAGLGLIMGAVLGAGQALVLRGRVPHPWRWVPGSALGWTVTMPVVFLGAGLAGPGWPLIAVAAIGGLTGLVGGGVLGLVTGPLLPSLAGAAVTSRPSSDQGSLAR